jgi:hypothetical protein
MRYTYLENYSGVMLTLRPSGQFTKTHSFCSKNGKSNFYEANPETLFGRVVWNEKVHTLAKFRRFITLYAHVLPST